MAGTPDVVVALNADAHARGAARTIEQFDNIATHAQYRTPYAITKRHVRAGDRVLDWGCGNGHFSFFLRSLGARVTGFSLETPPSSMAGSSEFEFVQGRFSDPRTLPFADATFDAVVGVGVLEHVWETNGDERASLAELARVLKPGGTLLTFHLPNRSGWVEKVVLASGLKKHFHKRKFDAAEIRALWGERGFAIAEMGLYNALPRAELSRLPGAIRHSRWFLRMYDGMDATIAAVAPSVCTNFFIVGRKTS